MLNKLNLSEETTIEFFSLHRHREGEEYLVGRSEISSYVTLSEEALQVIDRLNEGWTIGQVRASLPAGENGESDLQSFIEVLIACGFVRSINGQPLAQTHEPRHYTFQRLKQHHVAWLFSRPALIFYGLAAFVASSILAYNPDYIPANQDFFFHPRYTISALAIFAIGWLQAAVHEMWHLCAAKAMGLQGSISLGTRLNFVVAQTDVTDVWTIPRSRRYVVYLAGMAGDTLLIFLCLLFLLSYDHSLVATPIIWYRFTKAVILILGLGIIWQFRFNMQTDVYYVIANLFGCKNLLGDTQTYLRHLAARWVPRVGEVDLSAVPPREMQVVRLYAPFYLLGTVVTLGVFFLYTLPITLRLLFGAVGQLWRGYTADPAGFLDSVVLASLTTFYLGLLIYLSVRERLRHRQTTIQTAA